jgi:DNA modification methylase
VSEWWNRVYLGSCEIMAEIPNESVNACVTSPPYMGLREYEVDGQIGQEKSVANYVDRLVSVFREVRRVLREDGTVWLNIGDSYAGSWGAQGRSGQMADRSVVSARQIARHPQDASGTGSVHDDGLKPKDLIMVPHRLAIALQMDGWYVRDAIVWAKPNPMPSSVTDRCTSSYEMVFLLAKNGTKPLLWRAKDTREFVRKSPDFDETITVTEKGVLVKKPRWEGFHYYADMDAVREPLAAATLDRIRQSKWKSGDQAGSDRANGGAKTNGPMRAVVRPNGPKPPSQTEDNPDAYNEAGANLRNVWTIATTPYRGDHPAVMPRDLATRCIKIGCPPGGIVLDPFMGSGTVAECALGNGRRFVGYELNKKYHAEIANRLGLFGGAA